MKKLDISRYEIKDKKIDKNLKIVFLSDLHNTSIVKGVVEVVEKENPDYIIMGGDMINESITEIDNFIELCNSLDKKKIYYIFGNHEERLDENEYNDFINSLKENKIKYLNNQNINLSKNINLIGFVSELEKYEIFGRTTLDRSYITDKVGLLDKSKFNILVAHNPLEYNAYIEYGPNLILSGHVHGGLIRLPLLGALLSPDYTFFPRYSEGLYEKNNTKMIVSRGLGYSRRLKIRINNNFEVVVINLMKE